MFYHETKTEIDRFHILDHQTFVYLEQLNLGLTGEEQELMNRDIRHYGEKWREFMI